ncbi:unnamed protein product [Malus baccata var. baccata]
MNQPKIKCEVVLRVKLNGHICSTSLDLCCPRQLSKETSLQLLRINPTLKRGVTFHMLVSSWVTTHIAN